METRRLIVSVLMTCSLGCSHLLIEPEDDPASKRRKVAARVAIGLMTLGVTELTYACARGREPTVLYRERWGESAAEAWSALRSEERLMECRKPPPGQHYNSPPNGCTWGGTAPFCNNFPGQSGRRGC